ncbi:MAG: hypothetical protein H7836_04310 [Magnetococcus sp. YQC-3]
MLIQANPTILSGYRYYFTGGRGKSLAKVKSIWIKAPRKRKYDKHEVIWPKELARVGEKKRKAYLDQYAMLIIHHYELDRQRKEYEKLKIRKKKTTSKIPSKLPKHRVTTREAVIRSRVMFGQLLNVVKKVIDLNVRLRITENNIFEFLDFVAGPLLEKVFKEMMKMDFKNKDTFLIRFYGTGKILKQKRNRRGVIIKSESQPFGFSSGYRKFSELELAIQDIMENFEKSMIGEESYLFRKASKEIYFDGVEIVRIVK